MRLPALLKILFPYRRETASLFSSALLSPPALVIIDYFLLHFLHASGFCSMPGSQVFVELPPSLPDWSHQKADCPELHIFLPQPPDSQDYHVRSLTVIFISGVPVAVSPLPF